jgi:hypothetical protein
MQPVFAFLRKLLCKAGLIPHQTVLNDVFAAYRRRP